MSEGKNLVTQRPAAKSNNNNNLRAPESIKAQNLQDQYTNNDGNTVGAILWAPTHKKPIHVVPLIKSYVMELIGSFFMIFFTVFSVVSAVNGSADTAVRSLLVAITAGGSYFMVTGWLRKPDEELPRHASWLVTLFYMFTLRFGLFHSLIYLAVQTIGALAASGVLSALGPGAATEEVWIPQLVGTSTQSWCAEIFATGLILFSLGYNHMGGNPSEEEDSQLRHGETMASLMRAVATLVFFRLGHFTFDPAIYLGGLFSSCWNSGCLSSETGLHLSAGFFIGVPFIGLIAAILFYLVGVALSGTYGGKERRARGAMLQNKIHTSFSGKPE